MSEIVFRHRQPGCVARAISPSRGRRAATTRSKGGEPLGRLARGSLVLLAVAVLCVIVLSGCSQADRFKRAPVEGYVSIDGAPLKAGSIRFIPTGDSKGPAAVATIEEGIYQLPAESGPLVGSLRVEIEAINHLGFEIDDEAAYAKQAAASPQVAKNPVPEAFNRQSKLVVEMPEEGQTDLDFRLTSAGVLADSR